MKDQGFIKHNATVRASNPIPAVIPDAPGMDEIQSVIAAYNQAESQQYERLGAIYMHCVQNKKRAVNFVGGGRWTNFQDSDRPDIGLDRYVAPFIVYIDSIE